ncbi:hypothetical protein V7S43_004316 [Phytophthora oleae]|uniref:Uncharacterized protein n=1 Tax=Phytophthora oleae TaxID=2107226 RepID=A0ABD3G1P6_9STRA
MTSKQLETEVEWTKEVADRLDRSNQSLTRENQRLKTQFSTKENDREFLVKQLVTVKKDNVSLQVEIDTLHQQLTLDNRNSSIVCRSLNQLTTESALSRFISKPSDLC